MPEQGEEGVRAAMTRPHRSAVAMRAAVVAPLTDGARALAGTCRALLTRTLPGSRTRTILPFALFAAVQLADATLTATGVSRFGMSVEANPLVASYIDVWGLTAGLFAAKALAISAGAILHAAAQHFALALLTVIFVFAALVPWALALASP